MKILSLAIVSATIIAAATTASAQKQPKFKWGGDIRLRTIYQDNIPYSNTTAEAGGGASSYQTYRTRVYGEFHPTEDLYLRSRLMNEFRTMNHPRTRNAWAAFDETVFDNLFIDYTTDMFDIRIGRQEMMYGTGKVIMDGTGKDGSRSSYFDAAKITYKGIADTTVDFLAMYTHAKDPLAIHSQHRDIVGYKSATYDGVEAGGGIYVKNNSFEDLPWEAYFITKTKQDGLPNNERVDTVGARFMPKSAGGNLDGNVELAYQSNQGSSEIMIDAVAKLHIDALSNQNGTLGLGWYYLSEDWNPVFSRWAQYSDLYAQSYATTGIAAWKNLSMPHVDFSISPIKGLKTDLMLGYMMAPENDGLGGGHNRGWLLTCKNSFTLKKGLFSESDSLGGHLLLEVFEPENYYIGSQQDKTASFVRAELSYSF